MSGSNSSLIALGKAPQKHREELGLSLEVVAKKDGIAARALALIEAGEREPGVIALVALAKALRVPVSKLLGEEPAADLPAPRPPPHRPKTLRHQVARQRSAPPAW